MEVLSVPNTKDFIASHPTLDSISLVSQILTTSTSLSELSASLLHFAQNFLPIESTHKYSSCLVGWMSNLKNPDCFGTHTFLEMDSDGVSKQNFTVSTPRSGSNYPRQLKVLDFLQSKAALHRSPSPLGITLNEAIKIQDASWKGWTCSPQPSSSLDLVSLHKKVSHETLPNLVGVLFPVICRSKLVGMVLVEWSSSLVNSMVSLSPLLSLFASAGELLYLKQGTNDIVALKR